MEADKYYHAEEHRVSVVVHKVAPPENVQALWPEKPELRDGVYHHILHVWRDDLGFWWDSSGRWRSEPRVWMPSKEGHPHPFDSWIINQALERAKF